MDQPQENKKPKQKGFASFLLPSKPSNKVGVAVSRSQSARESHNMTVCERKSPLKMSRRPLSFDRENGTVATLVDNCAVPLSCLKRQTSKSENTIFNIKEENENVFDKKPLEKYGSHESVLKEGVNMLHLIPTTKARQRNFLHGKIGANSMLGSKELDRVCPNREITIFVGTWNMNGHSAPKELNDFVLPIGIKHVPDILTFGTQESCSERYEWEVSLQETIGPSHILYHSTSLGTLHLCIFIRRDLIWYISVPEEANLSVRPGTAFRTKGAVASSFMIFGTSFLFVTAHLTAHQEKVKERVSDVKKIVNSLDLPRNLPCKNKSKDVTQNFDYVFWSGDLNFRLATPRSKVLEWVSKTSFPLPDHLPHGYLHHDQLCTVLADGAAFRGFSEAKITFPPTYKYDPGTQNFDTSSKQRTPAYTDRILYKQKNNRRLSGALENPPLQCLIYDSVPSITTSDHKPVWGVFRAHVRPGLDTIPLAAGLFNRDVYLEGLKRRAETLSKSKGINLALHNLLLKPSSSTASIDLDIDKENRDASHLRIKIFPELTEDEELPTTKIIYERTGCGEEISPVTVEEKHNKEENLLTEENKNDKLAQIMAKLKQRRLDREAREKGVLLNENRTETDRKLKRKYDDREINTPEQQTTSGQLTKKVKFSDSDSSSKINISEKMDVDGKLTSQKVIKKSGRRSILGISNVTRSSQLTPKAKKIYITLKNWSIKMANRQKQIDSYKKRLADAKEVIEGNNFQNLRKLVNDPTYHFMLCQVRNQKLLPKGRRFTFDEKILALSVYKSSGKCYKLLSKVFALPSTKTLNRLLQILVLEPGINEQLFQSLANQVAQMKERDKTSILVFDEMEIDPHLSYNRKKDKMEGFLNTANEKESTITDHACVFMLKGVSRLWKQPIAFTFSKAGLDVVGTVCDQRVMLRLLNC